MMLLAETLDPSSESIASLRSKLGLGDRAQVGYSQEMPFAANSFDIVVMSEVLEHLSDDVIARTFKEVKRVLRAEARSSGRFPRTRTCWTAARCALIAEDIPSMGPRPIVQRGAAPVDARL
jgi:ubiquinone/menaquinone biosynthesis C-methylase UbiE